MYMSCRSGRLKNQHQKRPPSHAERASTAGWARPARNGRWPTGPSSGSFPGAPDCLQFPRSDGATGSSSGGRAWRANRYFSQSVYRFRHFLCGIHPSPCKENAGRGSFGVLKTSFSIVKTSVSSFLEGFPLYMLKSCIFFPFFQKFC